MASILLQSPQLHTYVVGRRMEEGKRYLPDFTSREHNKGEGKYEIPDDNIVTSIGAICVFSIVHSKKSEK